MKIKYAKNKLTDLEMSKLCETLQDRGLNVADWGYSDVPTYGKQTKTTETKIYTVVNSRNKVVYGDSYVSIRDDAFNQISKVYKVSKSSYVDTVTKTEWVEPAGQRLSLRNEDADAEITTNYHRNYSYENGVDMKVTYYNDYLGIGVEFEITWETDKIQRKEAIEKMVVETPLRDMGRIQKIFERALAHYTDIDENPVIDCHFDAKTESRSECTPDVIKLVREARNQ